MCFGSALLCTKSHNAGVRDPVLIHAPYNNMLIYRHHLEKCECNGCCTAFQTHSCQSDGVVSFSSLSPSPTRTPFLRTLSFLIIARYPLRPPNHGPLRGYGTGRRGVLPHHTETRFVFTHADRPTSSNLNYGPEDVIYGLNPVAC